ncbi:hypothetical protein MA03_04690 [Infirmifilum uzonense]|uniref:Amidohydrolase-related domain-containing protein n=1 Tax=Infirmifilum uzonense TaxID=1550241 RepID=A0A0F7FIF1_9CREN|nr:amidohydrolase family protein [Infirmifilum uzonense]AKG38715.1 hypothetical protein MA03_04690 [Infirmifilum uzonense]
MAYVFKQCSLVYSSEGILRDVDILVHPDGRINIGEELAGEEKVPCKGLLVVHGFANLHTQLTHYFYKREFLSRLNWSSHHDEPLPKESAISLAVLSLYNTLETGTTLIVDASLYAEEISVHAGKIGLNYIISARWPKKEVSKGKVILIDNFDSIEEDLEDLREYQEKAKAFLMIHVSNSKEQVFGFKRRKGRYPIEYLYMKNLLGSRTILISPAWLTSWELSLLAETETRIVQAPIAGLYTGEGLLPHEQLRNRGVTPALCSESPSLGLTLDMLEQLKTYYLFQRGFFENIDYTISDAYLSATSAGYNTLMFEGGEIRDGAKADLLFYSLEELSLPTYQDANLLFFGLNTKSLEYVVVNGQIIFSPEKKQEILAEKRRLIEKLMDQEVLG